jgi:hypothetical protein
MLYKNPHLMRHIPQEELIRSADGELSPQHAAEVKAHLEACRDCRARMEEVQFTIAGFVRAHHDQFDSQLPPDAGPRALLRARLTEWSLEPRTEWWKRAFPISFAPPRLAIVCLALMVIAIGAIRLRHSSQQAVGATAVLSDSQLAPNRNLTPGATRQVTMSEVCSTSQEEVVGYVSASLQQRVFQEYGIANASPQDYEVDYLIAPQLGGIDDIRNLWPQPYGTGVWNAQVKDALEERLHEMVCSGKVDLSTAQHDIATDWIAAYKKYFHTDRPLAPHSRLG